MSEYTVYKKRVFLICLITSFVMFFLGGVYIGNQTSVGNSIVSKLPFLRYSAAQANTSSQLSDLEMSKFWYVWSILEKKYPFKEKQPNTEEKIYGAISGLVSSYADPYTMFFPPSQAKIFAEDVKGEFGGIGVEIGIRNGLPTIIAPLKNSPAQKAGLRSGDIILSVDDHEIKEVDIDKIVSWIRGNEGSIVTLKVIRKDTKNTLEYKVTREKIQIPVLETETKNNVFVIHFYTFSEKSAVLFTNALENFKASGKNKLLIDMRGNPGGYLDSAVDIASAFLPAGTTIVKEDNGSSKEMSIYRSYGYAKVAESVQIGVLLDEGSASASEILAGALQDHKRATVYGTKSFGKGSVQELIPLSDGSSVKITIAKWLTPNGNSISEKGITPDVIIETEKIIKNKTTDAVLDQVVASMGRK